MPESTNPPPPPPELRLVGEPLELPADRMLEIELMGERRARAALLARETAQEAVERAAMDGRTKHGAYLLVAPIQPGRMESLRAVLAEIADDVETNALLPFLKLKTVHYARFVIHEEARDVHGAAIPAKLLFATDYDGGLDAHLDELVREGAEGLDRVFAHCVGYGSFTPERMRGWLRANQVTDATTHYVGAVGRSVSQIRREAYLRDAVEEYLDRETAAGTLPPDPVAIRQRIVRHLFEEQGDRFAWARIQPPPFPEAVPFKSFLKRVGIVSLLLLPLTLLALLFAAGWAAVLRYKEKRDPVSIRADVKELAGELAKQEDLVTQNQLSSVLNIKPGWFRDRTLRAVLAFIAYSARRLETGGTLNGIASIHFARWNIVDEGRRLVFFSNFDGSWESYLGEFVDKAADGLTGVWSNCVGFPRTRFLIFEGATDEQKFKAYSRAGQVPTQVWYTAYKWLSLPNINNNTRIRLGLHGDMSREQATEWLRRF